MLSTNRTRRVTATSLVVALLAGLLAVLPLLPAHASHGAFDTQISVADAEIAEGNSGTTTMTFTITGSTTNTATVGYETQDFTASSDPAGDPDYVPASGVVVLSPGATTSTATVSVTILGDTELEGNEFFTLVLTSTSNGHIVDSSGRGTIINDDGAAVSIEDVDVSEGAGTASLTVSLPQPATADVTLSYDTSSASGGPFGPTYTATANEDYTAVTNGSATIEEGDSETEVTVPILQDSKDESDETFAVLITVESGPAAAGDTTGVVTILDDDDQPRITIENAQIAEGEGSEGVEEDTRSVLSFEVTRSGPSPTGAITFDIDVQGVTATETTTVAPGDYTVPEGNPLGADYTMETTDTKLIIEIKVDGDTTPEPHETLTVEIINLSNNADFGVQRKATGTILNDDASPQVTPLAATVEGDNAPAQFEVSIPFPSVRPVTLEYWTTIVRDNGLPPAEDADTLTTSTSDFHGIAAADAVEVSLPAGTTKATRSILLKEDSIDEPDEETFTVNVSATSAGASGSATAHLIILDDDAAPTVSVDNRSVNEGDGGTSDVAMTVRLSAASERFVSYTVTTVDGTATAGEDYTTTTSSGTIGGQGGSLTATVFVPVHGDIAGEEDETVLLQLSNVSNGVAAGEPGVLTIIDEDETLAIGNGSGPESGGSIPIKVILGAARTDTVTVDYASADGTATVGEDYTAVSGTLTYTPGQVEKTINVPVSDDGTDEGDETVIITLSNASSNVVVADSQGTVTIEDDDGTSISVDDVEVIEGHAGTTDAVFTVRLTNTSASDVDFDFTTQPDTAAGGIGPLADDYETTSGQSPLSNGTIAAGDLTTTVTVPVQGDTDVEDDEQFMLVISSVTGGATIDDDTGIGTIINDDSTLSIADASVTEGNSGTKQIDFTVSISQPSAVAVEFEYDTADGTATASSNDYEAVTDGGPVTIPAGETSTKISITVNGDTTDEENETFSVTLKNPVNATIADGTATGTIVDNDGEPTISISDASVTEGNADTVDMVFSVSLSAASSKEVTVEYATADGTAKADDGDYQATSGELTFNPGDTVLIVTVVVAGDTKDEGTSENMRVLLSNPANATIGDGTGIGTINDDDGPDTNGKPTLDAGSNRAVETSASVLYRATTSDPNGDTVVVTWNFGDGSDPVIGNPVSHAYAGVGLYTVNVTASDGKGGTATDSFTVNAFDTGVIGRAWGDDRILTAVAASQAHWPAGHAQASGHTGAAATDAMIALSDKYPDALAAGPLSTKLDAPLLLSGPSSLPSVVEDELERLGVDTVWLLGGPNSLSPAIEQRLKDLGYEVKRRSGSNRFETAAAVAKEVGRNSAGEVVVTLGDHADQNRAFPDALSAGSLSASPQRMPVVLTLTDSIPAVTEQALADLNTKKVWIVGGLASVSANVEARLRSLGYTVERLAGPGRYETSVDVAEEALSRAPDGPVRLVFATGAKFPDGLAGGAVAGRVDGIMLLVPNGDLPAATRQFLADNADRFDVGVILGGTNTLSESVRLALADLMDK